MKRWVRLRCALGKRYRGKRSVSDRLTERGRQGSTTKTLSDFHLLKSKLFSELGVFGGGFFVCILKR